MVQIFDPVVQIFDPVVQIFVPVVQIFGPVRLEKGTQLAQNTFFREKLPKPWSPGNRYDLHISNRTNLYDLHISNRTEMGFHFF